MKDFSGKTAVVTGGGSGIGRALIKQLTHEGCSVAMCDISTADMEETRKIVMQDAPQGVKVSCFEADVADRALIDAFRDHVKQEHDLDHVHLLFNNAGVGGAGSFVADPAEAWERTFNICWQGVYNNCRAFMPMLIAADEARVVNVSSVNGFWANIGLDTPHTAYSAAKFAVKGFTEALQTDFAVHAPHVKAVLVMPGYIGTNITHNSQREHQGKEYSQTNPNSGNNMPLTQEEMDAWKDNALSSPEYAAQTILDGIKNEEWRVLVGADAHMLDQAVRADPEGAYREDFVLKMMANFGIEPK